MQKRKRFGSKLNKVLEIPDEISTNNPKITVTGFSRILIENFKGILEYEETCIKINTFIGKINVNGINLNMQQMTSDDIEIIGLIDGIEFENSEEEI